MYIYMCICRNSTCKELKYTCTCTVMENHHTLQFNYYTTGTCSLLYCTTNAHLKYSTLHCTALYTFSCTYGWEILAVLISIITWKIGHTHKCFVAFCRHPKTLPTIRSDYCNTTSTCICIGILEQKVNKTSFVSIDSRNHNNNYSSIHNYIISSRSARYLPTFF